jgi:hypothetical protein
VEHQPGRRMAGHGDSYSAPETQLTPTPPGRVCLLVRG